MRGQNSDLNSFYRITNDFVKMYHPMAHGNTIMDKQTDTP